MTPPPPLFNEGSAVTYPIDVVTTLAHTPGGVMIGVLLLATAVGFIAGMFFERAVSRRTRNREN